ncbi:MAG: hypothetical protein WCM93_13055 [Bacteroidota bacterium]
MNRYFSTPPIFSAPVTSIDRERGIIQGVTICQVGPAKGLNGFIDKAFLLQIVEDASTKSAGIKARFGHPNMCSQALGTYLGRFKNYSYSGTSVKADLCLDDTAKNTPSGDLYSYILDMAEKNPDMFGASIVFEIGESVFLDEEVDGKKVEKEYFRLKELRATDIVDEPAATNGLFSANTFPGIATQFLDENPQILDLILSKPDSITEFLSNYITNSKMNISEKIKQNFAAFLASFSAPTTEHTALSTEHTAPSTEHFQSEDNTLNTLFDALCTSYPDSFADSTVSTQLQKAEAITVFLESQASKTSALAESNEALQEELESRNLELETLRQQLKAHPSIPLNVTDPALSFNNKPADTTGKDLLNSIPKDLKRKLSHSTKTN